MSDISEEKLGHHFAQTYLVIRCVVRALVQQPDFDAMTFLRTLQKEESQMNKEADVAKEVIKTIISEVEGYS